MRRAAWLVIAALGGWACSGGGATIDGSDDAGGGGGDATVPAPEAGGVVDDAGGGTDSGGGTDAGGGTDSGGGTDAGGGKDGGSDASIQCGNVTCTGGQVCCVSQGAGGIDYTCGASCSDGGFPVTCDGPEDCSSATSICCATLTVGAGTPPNCPPQSVTASCAATCATSINPTCPSTSTVRLCHKAADCANNQQYNRCCQFTQAGQTATFCADLVTSLGATQCFQ